MERNTKERRIVKPSSELDVSTKVKKTKPKNPFLFKPKNRTKIKRDFLRRQHSGRVEISKYHLKRVVDELKNKEFLRSKNHLIGVFGTAAEFALTECAQPSWDAIHFPCLRVDLHHFFVNTLLRRLSESLWDHDWRCFIELLDILINGSFINSRFFMTYILRCSLLALLNCGRSIEYLEEFCSLSLGINEDDVKEFIDSLFVIPETIKIEPTSRNQPKSHGAMSSRQPATDPGAVTTRSRAIDPDAVATRRQPEDPGTVTTRRQSEDPGTVTTRRPAKAPDAMSTRSRATDPDAMTARSRATNPDAMTTRSTAKNPLDVKEFIDSSFVIPETIKIEPTSRNRPKSYGAMSSRQPATDPGTVTTRSRAIDPDAVATRRQPKDPGTVTTRRSAKAPDAMSTRSRATDPDAMTARSRATNPDAMTTRSTAKNSLVVIPRLKTEEISIEGQTH